MSILGKIMKGFAPIREEESLYSMLSIYDVFRKNPGQRTVWELDRDHRAIEVQEDRRPDCCTGFFGCYADTGKVCVKTAVVQSYIISFDGEIYNIPELLSENGGRMDSEYGMEHPAEALGVLFERTNPEETIAKLNGMFAIAAYDLRKRILYIARDRFGACPLHLWMNDRSITWSSTVKGICGLPGFDRRVDIRSMHRSFMYAYDHKPLFSSITDCEPGVIIRVHPETFNTNEYRYFDIAEERKLHYREHYVRDVDRLLSDAVRREIGGKKAIGVQLSGGIDSTLIAKKLTEFREPCGLSLNAYTIALGEDSDISEERGAAFAADAIKLNLDAAQMDGDIFAELLEETVYAYERILTTQSPIGLYAINRVASSFTDTVFCGEAADALCSGGSLNKKHVFLKKYAETKLNKYKPGSDDFILDIGIYIPAASCVKMLYNFDPIDSLKEKRRFWDALKGSLMQKMRCAVFNDMLIGELERQYKIAKANAIDCRFPFLDNCLTDYVFTLQESALLKRNKTRYPSALSKEVNRQYERKYVLRQISSKTYGNDFAYSGKTAMRMPLGKYLGNPLIKDYVHDQIIPKMAERGIIRTEKFIEDFRNDININAGRIFKAIGIEIWCQLFVDGRMPIRIKK